MELQPDAPKPRLCHIIKWPDFDGYGFNLHAEKSKIGQYIGKVDQDSPAMHAGLIEGDKIIEVNGVNISNENHRQVVERIKSIPHETKLLVIDEQGDKWYKERKITIKSSQSNVLYIKTPVPKPGSLNGYTINNNNNDDEQCDDVKCNDNNNEQIKSTNEENNKEQQNNVNENVNVIKENEKINDESLNKNADESNHTTNGNINDNLNSINKNEENSNNKEMSINNEINDNNDNSINDKKIEYNNNNDTNKNNNHIDEGKLIEKAIETKSNDVDDGSIASSSPHSIKKMSSNGLIQENNNNINNANVKRPSSIASLESNAKTESIPGSPVSTKSGSIISSKDGLTNSLGDLNLNMSASEMRKLLAQRKKADPKKVQMDLKQKYEIIQQM